MKKPALNVRPRQFGLRWSQWSRWSWAFALLLLLVACPTDPARDSPLDPGSLNPSPGSIKGQISLDPSGDAYGLIRPEEVELWTGDHHVTPSPDGHFEITGLAPGNYDLYARATYFETASVLGVVVEPTKAAELPEILLQRGLGSMHGRVQLFGTDPASGDHSGTAVSVPDQPAEAPRFTLTNESGAFELQQVIAGRHRLRAAHAPYPEAGLEGVDVPAGGAADAVEFTLGTEAGQVEGTVQLEDHLPMQPDANDSCPASDLEMQAVSVQLLGVGGVVHPDDCGRFLLSAGLGGRFTLEASAPGYISDRQAEVKVVPDGSVTQQETPLQLRIARGDAHGRVQLSGGGDPSGVDVYVVGGNARAVSDASGEFVLRDILIGSQPSRQLFAQKQTGGALYRLDAPVTVPLKAGVLSEVGRLTLSPIGGDFGLVGRVYDRLATTPGWRDSPSLSASPWLRLQLASLNPTGYDELQRAESQAGLTNAAWLPFVLPANGGSGIDCRQAANQTQPYCFKLTGSAGGVRELWVAFRKSADPTGPGYGPFRSSILLDQSPPSRQAGGVALELANGAAYLKQGDPSLVSVALAAVDAESPVTSMLLWADGLDTADGFGTVAPGRYQTAASLSLPAGEGRKVGHVVFFDAAGNPLPDPVSAVDTPASLGPAHFSDTLIVDTLPPALPSLGTAGTLGESGSTVRGRTLQLSPTGGGDAGETLSLRVSEDPGLGSARSFVRVGEAGGTYPLTPPLYFVLQAGEGPHTVYAALMDAAGNQSPTVSAVLSLDTRPPAQPILWIDELDAQLDGLTRNSVVDLHLALDAATVEVELGGCGAAPIVLDYSAAAPSADEVQSCALSTGQGQKLVTASARDAAGNQSVVASASVILDTLPPAAPTLIVLPAPGAINPASPDNSPVGTTWVRTPQLSWTANLASGEVPTEMKLDEYLGSSATGAVLKSTGWFPYAPFGGLQLTDQSDQEHSVGVHYRDRAFNELQGSSYTVTLDSTAPLAPALAALPPEQTTEGQWVMQLTPLGASGEANFWKLQLQGGSVAGTPCRSYGILGCEDSLDGASIPIDLTLNALNVLRVRAVDFAGNIGGETLAFVVNDQRPPSVPVIVSPSDGDVTGATLVQVDLQGTVVDAAPGVLEGFEGYVDSVSNCISLSAYSALPGRNHFLFAIPSNGNATLCLRAKDRAGNYSSVAKVRLVQDSTPPLTPRFSLPSSATGTTVLAWMKTPQPGQLQTLDLHFDHFEAIGGPLTQWTCLPLERDPLTARLVAPANCNKMLPTDLRAVFELPLLPNQNNQLMIRAVDQVGLHTTGAGYSVQENSSWVLSAPGAGDASVNGDRVVWYRDTAPVQLMDLNLAWTPWRAGSAVAFSSDALELQDRPVDVWGDRVAWSVKDNVTIVGMVIRWCDLNLSGVCKGPPGQISSTIFSNDLQPRLDQSRIVARRNTGPNDWRLFAYYPGSLAGSYNPLVVDVATAAQQSWDLDAGHLVWVDNVSGPDSLWSLQLPAAPPSSSLSSTLAGSVTSDAVANSPLASVAGSALSYWGGSGPHLDIERKYLGGLSSPPTLVAASVGGKKLSSSEALNTLLTMVGDSSRNRIDYFVHDGLGGLLGEGSRQSQTELAPSALDSSFFRAVSLSFLDPKDPTQIGVELYEFGDLWEMGNQVPVQRYPALQGETLAWIETNPTDQVVLYDRTTKNLQTISDSGSYRYSRAHLSLDATGVLAWQEIDNLPFPKTSRVVVYHPATGLSQVMQSITGCLCNTAAACHPVADGGKVAWVGSSSTNTRICLYDEALDTTSVVASGGTNAFGGNLDMNAGEIAWLGEANNATARADVTVYSIGGASTTCFYGGAGCLQVEASPTLKTGISLDSNKLVWTYGGDLKLLDRLQASTPPVVIKANTEVARSHPILRGTTLAFAEERGVSSQQYRLRIYDLDRDLMRSMLPMNGNNHDAAANRIVVDGQTVALVRAFPNGQSNVVWYRPPGHS